MFVWLKKKEREREKKEKENKSKDRVCVLSLVLNLICILGNQVDLRRLQDLSRVENPRAMKKHEMHIFVSTRSILKNKRRPIVSILFTKRSQ